MNPRGTESTESTMTRSIRHFNHARLADTGLSSAVIAFLCDLCASVVNES